MLQPGQHLGIYRLDARIGAGGMGEVWKAEDTRLGRAVAIKILPATVAGDADAIARMKREARTAAQLYHPNIATIHAIEQDGDRLFIVMELVAGEPLTKLIRGGALTEADVCRIGRAVADALAEAHEKGIVHRDIKPDNIMVSGTRVKVLDFGIAKRVGLEAGSESGVITQQGMIVGTVNYMSPEQALGKPLDARSDLFSLGVVLYQAATGKMPFAGETITETITQIVRDEPEEARRINPSISAGLNALIARSMRKNRDERFQSAAELSAALDRQLGMASTAKTAHVDAFESAPTQIYTKAPAAPTVIEPRKKRVWLTAAWVAVFALAMIGWLLTRRSKTDSVPPPVTQTQTQPTERRADSQVRPPGGLENPPYVPPPPVVVESTREAPPPQPARPQASANELYDEGVARLVERNQEAARDAFRRVVEIDPHHAKAQFRLGELSLINGDHDAARDRFVAALADVTRLDDRERRLSELGLAIASGDRPAAHAIARQLHQTNPRDPDLFVMQRELGPPPEGFQRRPPRRIRP